MLGWPVPSPLRLFIKYGNMFIQKNTFTTPERHIPSYSAAASFDVLKAVNNFAHETKVVAEDFWNLLTQSLFERFVATQQKHGSTYGPNYGLSGHYAARPY